MKAVTLLYHDVVPENRPEISGFLTPGAARYKLAEAAFRRHLEAIAGACRNRPATVGEALQNSAGTPFLLTFDDGGASAYRPVSEMLAAYGWKAHFLVTTDYIGTSGFLTAAQIRELRAQGHVIGSHSCSHPQRMSACTREQLRGEWERSTAVLADILGEPVQVASIPAGYYSHEVARAADQAGIRALFSSEPQTTGWKVGNCMVLGRYGALAHTPPEWAAAIVRGDRRSRLAAYALWNVKKAVKKAAGPVWLHVRAAVLGPGGR